NAFNAFGGVAGHAGLFAPASDLLRFGDALLTSLRGEGPFERQVVRRFTAPGPEGGQALGFRTWPELGAVGHLGFPGVGVAILPGRDAAVAMVTNRLHVRGAVRPTDEMFRIALRAAHRMLVGS
ncbi:MAG: serine hydrolase, partial [Solirubrobacteraceae bacterium]